VIERVGALIVAHPRRMMGITALITLVAVGAMFRIQFNTDVASFLTEGNVRGEAYTALQAKYESSDSVNVLLSITGEGSFGDRDWLVELARYRESLADLHGVDQVASLIPRQGPGGVVITPEMVTMASDQAIEAMMASPFAQILVSADRRHSMLLVFPEVDGMAVARAIPDVSAPDGLAVTVSGNPAIYAAVFDILSLFLLLIPPIVLVLLVATFYLNVGSRRLSLLAVVPALLGSLWTFGLISGLGLPVDIVTVIVPIFVLVMGSADGLHFVAHFQDVSRETNDAGERVVMTLREVGVPMILTTVSTAAGFLSLLATDIHPLRQLGTFAAIGIGLAGVISFFSLPAAMTLFQLGDEPAHPVLGARTTVWLRRLVTMRWPALALIGLVVVFGAIFIPRLEVDSDPLFMFPEGHEVRKAFATTEEIFGGATPLVGEFVFDPANPMVSLDEIAEAAAELEQLPGVRSVVSAHLLVGSSSPISLEEVLSGEVETPIGNLVSDDGLRFLLLPGAFDTADLHGWLDYVEESGTVRMITGLPVLWDEMARLVLDAQRWSVVVALALVAAMLLVTYRRLRPTLVALLPLILTIVALLGFIAASGIQLNLITAVASSIVIGVGIDYAVHFVAAIDHARPGGPGYVMRGIDRAGRPIVANALGIAIALTALLLSPLRPHHHISGIMWVSMTVAALGALLVIPLLLGRDALEEPRV
jgi:uncharacterized protein